MSTEWDELFARAAEIYTGAVYRADLPSAEREAPAREFQRAIEPLRAGGPAALEDVAKRLRDRDAYRRNTAARILVLSGDPEADRHLRQAVADAGLPLDAIALRQWSTTFDREALERVAPWARGPLAWAMLRRQAPEARRFVEDILAADDIELGPLVIEAVASWGDTALLADILQRPPAERPPVAFLLADPRLDAAFRLDLLGDERGVAFLEAMARGDDQESAAHAVVRLAWLAWPGAVDPTSDLLRSSNVESAGPALDAAGSLRAAALGPALVDLSADRALAGSDLTEDARRVLEAIAGRERMEDLQPGRRYSRGEALTLSHLTEELLSSHQPVAHAAASNLRAITGQDHGFDAGADLIANINAISLWRKTAATLRFEPGGWMRRGAQLPPPR